MLTTVHAFFVAVFSKLDLWYSNSLAESSWSKMHTILSNPLAAVI